ASGAKASAPVVGRTAYHLHLELNSRLQIEVLGRRKDRIEALYLLKNPALQIAVNDSADAASAQTLERELMHPVLAEPAPRGQILEVRFAPETGAAAQRLSRSLLSLTQWVAPAPSGGSTVRRMRPGERWQTREDDPFGTCEAGYRLEAEPASEVAL